MESESDKSVQSCDGHDKYCFNCHKPDANCYCTSCCRSYHAKCVKKVKGLLQANMAGWRCLECTEIETAEQESQAICDDINIPLESTIRLILEDTMYRTLKRPIEDDSDAANFTAIYPMDLGKIEANVYSKQYASTRAFLSDIKWIYHNCFTLLSKTDQRLSAAKYLLNFTKEEILSIETCLDCYMRANSWAPNWFLIPCTKPHLLLWAKLRGFPYWPAKLFAIHGNTVTVRFFGQHTRAKVAAMNCRLMSENSPSKTIKKEEQANYRSAKNELLQYIDNFERKFGVFNYAPFNAPFYSSKVDKYLADTMTKVDGDMELFVAPEPYHTEAQEGSVEQNGFDSCDRGSENSDEEIEIVTEAAELMSLTRKRRCSVFAESSALSPATELLSADEPAAKAKSFPSHSHRRSLSTSESVFKMPDMPIIKTNRLVSPNHIQRSVSKLDSVGLPRDNQLSTRCRRQSISVQRNVPARTRSHSIAADAALCESVPDRMFSFRRNSTYVRERSINEMVPAMKYHSSRAPVQFKTVSNENGFAIRNKNESISKPIDACDEEDDDCIIVAVSQRRQYGPKLPTATSTLEKSPQSTLNKLFNADDMVSKKQLEDYMQIMAGKIESLEHKNQLLSVENTHIKQMLANYTFSGQNNPSI